LEKCKTNNKTQTNKKKPFSNEIWSATNYNLKQLWNCHNDDHQNPILLNPDATLSLEYIHAEMIYLCMWLNSRCMSSPPPPNNPKKNIIQVYLYPCRTWYNVLWSSEYMFIPITRIYCLNDFLELFKF
jgi:hypothetical protein